MILLTSRCTAVVWFHSFPSRVRSVHHLQLTPFCSRLLLSSLADSSHNIDHSRTIALFAKFVIYDWLAYREIETSGIRYMQQQQISYFTRLFDTIFCQHQKAISYGYTSTETIICHSFCRCLSTRGNS